MDGWIDGWMDRWMDGWMDGWMGRSVDKLTIAGIDIETYIYIYGYKYRQMHPVRETFFFLNSINASSEAIFASLPMQVLCGLAAAKDTSGISNPKTNGLKQHDLGDVRRVVLNQNARACNHSGRNDQRTLG